MSSPAESANPGMLAVGAAHYWETDTAVTFYSNRGPTPDGRIKPDIVGTDCAASASYEVFNSPRLGGIDCWFPGTSQASPHVAGLAALVRQKFPDYSPDQVADYLKHFAEPREAPDDIHDADPTDDINNVWGHGFAVLPAPGAEPPTGFDTGCRDTISGDGTVTGQWSDGCDSTVAERGHARYYTFSLEEQSEAAITLESTDADTYLYLRQGHARSGTALHDNDDIESGNTNSRIVATLSAGTYTIEATTYSTGETGTFTLSIGLSRAAVTPTPGDDCEAMFNSDGECPGPVGRRLRVANRRAGNNRQRRQAGPLLHLHPQRRVRGDHHPEFRRRRRLPVPAAKRFPLRRRSERPCR